MSLDGEVALVTGGAKGSGEAHVRELVSRGALVAICDVLDERGEALATELGDSAIYVHLDVSQEADWRTAIEAVEAALGSVTVLVNNAGVAHGQPLDEYDLGEWARVLSIDLTGVLLGMKYVTPGMKRLRHGSIINVSSLMATRGAVGSYAYVAAKWGVRGLSKSAAIELGRYGIRVNTLLPGFIETDMTAQHSATDLEIPLRRGGTTGELAKTVAFLASSDSSFTTGAEFLVDGGQTSNIGGWDELMGFTLRGPLGDL